LRPAIRGKELLVSQEMPLKESKASVLIVNDLIALASGTSKTAEILDRYMSIRICY
jgi:hypothetical protein